MFSRRSLMGGLATGAAFGVADAAAGCPVAYDAYEPTDADRAVMLARIAAFRAAYNAGALETALVKAADFAMLRAFGNIPRGNSPEEKVRLLRTVREDYGAIRTNVSPETTMFWPQSAKVYLVAEMERRPISHDDYDSCVMGIRPPLCFVFDFETDSTVETSNLLGTFQTLGSTQRLGEKLVALEVGTYLRF